MPHAKWHISHSLPSVIIQSDASQKGLGAVFEGQEIEVFVKSMTFSCWICGLNLYLLSSRSERQNLLEVAKTTESCSKQQKLLQICQAQLGQVRIPGEWSQCIFSSMWQNDVDYFLFPLPWLHNNDQFLPDIHVLCLPLFKERCNVIRQLYFLKKV